MFGTNFEVFLDFMIFNIVRYSRFLEPRHCITRSFAYSHAGKKSERLACLVLRQPRIWKHSAHHRGDRQKCGNLALRYNAKRPIMFCVNVCAYIYLWSRQVVTLRVLTNLHKSKPSRPPSSTEPKDEHPPLKCLLIDAMFWTPE